MHESKDREWEAPSMPASNEEPDAYGCSIFSYWLVLGLMLILVLFKIACWIAELNPKTP